MSDWKSDWSSYVAPLVHTYNCTKHETTQFSPNFVLFGREPRMAIELLPPCSADPVPTYSAYIAELQKCMQHAQKVVGDRIRKAGEASKAWYSKKVCGATLHPGDQFWRGRWGFKGSTGLLIDGKRMCTWLLHNLIHLFPCLQYASLKGRDDLGHCTGICCCQSGLFPQPCLLLVLVHQSFGEWLDHRWSGNWREIIIMYLMPEPVSPIRLTQLLTVLVFILSLVCGGDSSLDLDEDEVSILLEVSVVLGPGSATARCSEGGGYEADSSDSDARPASSPQQSVSLPRRIARRRVQPVWMRTGESDVHWGCIHIIWYVVLILFLYVCSESEMWLMSEW